MSITACLVVIAFDDRCANLYEALYYTKNTSESHQELVDALFRQPLPPPADQQKETFQSILADTLGGDCSLDVVQSVQGRLVDMMAQHKEDKDPEPLVLSKGALDMVLSISGVEEEHREAFSQRFEEAFGENARVSPQNLVDKKRLEVWITLTEYLRLAAATIISGISCLLGFSFIIPSF